MFCILRLKLYDKRINIILKLISQVFVTAKCAYNIMDKVYRLQAEMADVEVIN
jgi:hypothetical protein